MNKLGLVLALIIAAVAILFVVRPSSNPGGTAANNSTNNGSSTNLGTANTSGGVDANSSVERPNASDDSQTSDEQADRPATEVYKSSEEALAAVKGGAGNYDDIILEQFTDLGPDCTWCDQFYKSVTDLMQAGDTPNEQKSYYAELLAISGRKENLQALIDSVENPQPGQDPQVALEAVEMAVGKDDVVNYLGQRLGSTQNPQLKESLVAAVSNQGSTLAVNTLYKATLESGNPDGYYSQGTGLGEVIPDEEAFGTLKEIAQKKDDYSHLAVKALLNAGLDGLKSVYDLLNNSNGGDIDQKILKDAKDHINYDEDTEKFLRETVEKSSNPALVSLAKSTLEDFDRAAKEAEEAPEEGEFPVTSDSVDGGEARP